MVFVFIFIIIITFKTNHQFICYISSQSRD